MVWTIIVRSLINLPPNYLYTHLYLNLIIIHTSTQGRENREALKNFYHRRKKEIGEIFEKHREAIDSLAAKNIDEVLAGLVKICETSDTFANRKISHETL